MADSQNIHIKILVFQDARVTSLANMHKCTSQLRTHSLNGIDMWEVKTAVENYVEPVSSYCATVRLTFGFLSWK